MGDMGIAVLGAVIAFAFLLIGIALIVVHGKTEDETAELTGFGIFMIIVAVMMAIMCILPTLYL